jgi:hypothetical protein
MSAVVIVTSVLYIRGFLSAAFSRTHEIAVSISNQIQSAVLAEVEARTAAEPEPPTTIADAKRFWANVIRTDPQVTETLKRALTSWPIISGVFIADEKGRILASSDPARVGEQPPLAVNFAEWSRRSLIGNFRQVFLERENTQLVRPVSTAGQTTPVITIHVVISSLFLRNSVWPELSQLGWIFIISLLISIALALVLPNVILGPLERLGRSIDLIATGRFPVAPLQPKRESKEVADVYSKLTLLGQQFQGARADARELRTNVEHLLQRLEQAVLLFDPKGKLVMAGKPVGRLLGADPNTLVGLAIHELFPPESELGAIITQAIEGNEAIRDRHIIVRSGDGERRLILTAEPLTDEEGRGIGTLIMLRDAETRGEIASQLDIAERLSALNRLTRSVAHEIKNPLQAITVHLEMLKTKLDGDSPELDVISREISRLDRVVKTFLDFNRPVEPQMRPIDLCELAVDIAQLVQPHAGAHGVTVEARSAVDAAWICGDQDLLKQAILNVVMNGIEAMKDGGALSIETRRAGRNCQIAVSDTGPGIPPDIQDKIFNLYFSTKEHGSGIGLAIAFRFVQLHDGKIEFTTQPGQGTTFRFGFPEATSHPSRRQLEMSQVHRA